MPDHADDHATPDATMQDDSGQHPSHASGVIEGGYPWPAWGQLRTRRWLIVGLVFILHVVLRYEVLDTPPYWDSVQGPFVEANWLVDNDFNYKKLLYDEKDFPSGGPAVYVWSIIPTFYAATSIIFGGPAGQFMFLHLFTFLLAGLIVMALHEMLHQVLGVRSWLALLVGALAVLQPTIGGQVDAINMELPLATAVVFTTWNLIRGRWVTAGLLGLLGVFIKESGVLICLVSLVIGAAYWYSQPMSWARRIGLTLLYLLPLGVLAGMQKLFVLAGHFVSTETKPTSLSTGIAHIREAVWPHVPDLYTLMPLASLAIPLVAWLAWRRRPTTAPGLRPLLAAVVTSPAARLYLATAAISAGWLLMHLLRGAILIRYMTWYVPLFILFIFLTVRYLGTSRRVQGILVSAYLLYALVNQFGVLLPTLKDRYARTGDLRERSREYIEDVKLMVAMTTWLDQNAGDRPVLLQAPLDRAVADPRLGYTTRRLNVFSLSYPGLEAPDVPFFLDLTPAAYHQAYIGYFPSIYYHPDSAKFSPGSERVVLQSFADPPAPVYVYRVRPSAETLANPPPGIIYYHLQDND